MADLLQLDILTPTGPVRLGHKDAGDHQSTVAVPGVEVPGYLGELGVLPGHIPFITPVVPGVVRFRLDGESRRVAVGVGFLEVNEDGRVSILTERARLPEQIEVDQVREQLASVRKALVALADYALDSPEHQLLITDQAWLESQLRAAETTA
jgi:F-type H+-transporting ATPase subunit epsilon